MQTDPIADMITRIRNALLLKHKTVCVNYSNLNKRIVQLLCYIGYINSFSKINSNVSKIILIQLKYDIYGHSVIHGIKRISKPGLRVYNKIKNTSSVYSGIGTSIISTSNGLMTTYKAKKMNIGGEIMFIIW